MMRAVVQWLRVAAPPRWSLFCVLAVVIYELVYGWWVWQGQGAAFATVLLHRDLFWLIAALSVGASRAYDYHPLFQQKYRDWLRLTPWTSRKTLPIGPVHLVPQDALWLGLVLAVWHDPQLSRLYLPLCYLFSYLAVVCVSCLATEVTVIGWLLAFGLGEVVRQWYSPMSALLVAFWLYLVGWIGIRQSLAKFPWSLSWVWNLRSLQAIAEEQKQRMLGWPLDQLRGRLPEQGIRLLPAAGAGLLAGWWSYCVRSLITVPLEAIIVMWMMLSLITITAVVGRSLGYWLDYRPPISLWGRIWTLRWIVPGYDHICIPPLLILLVAGFLPEILTKWHVPSDVGLAITISAVLMLALALPPTYQHWRLTGFHRIVPGSTNKQEFEKI